ncbi:hypothetical protein [Clostridium perfringens]|uniref:hypothetical protein n=1 Tax=Clostridium perfringens TaxID=1502 RepID=UPI0024BCFAE6|nr:hypothetical protein [Clostridium perfringens]
MKNLIRKKILNFLQWNDKNGYYTDEICSLENIPRLTLEDSIKFFFGVINSDFYYYVVDNIFELTLYEAIQYSKINGFYNKTCEKLKLLINTNTNELDLFYKGLLN